MRKSTGNKVVKVAAAGIAAMMMLVGCSSSKPAATTAVEATAEATTEAVAETVTEAETTTAAAAEETTILVAAAASLKYSYDEELIPMFVAANPGIKVDATYDSSGKLQTQIEEGLGADVFMSAATKQMNALKDENMVDADSIVNLLENKIVLIVPTGMDAKVTGFEDIANADMIAIAIRKAYRPDSMPKKH